MKNTHPSHIRRFYYLLYISIIFCIITSASHAGTRATITVNDGSVIVGEVVSLTDGVYTIQTSDLGTITVHENDVRSIVKGTPPETAVQTPTTTKNAPALQADMQGMQANIHANPQMMLEIQSLAQDKELMKLLADPALLKDLLSYDPARIEQNQTFQELLKNPKVQELLQLMQDTGTSPQQ